MSEIRATTISDETGNGPIALTKQHAAKAWIKTPADLNNILASFGVSSLDDDGTGDGGVNLTSAMSDANYVVTGSTISASSTAVMTIDYDGTQVASSFEFEIAYVTASNNRTAVDRIAYQSVHGDLA